MGENKGLSAEEVYGALSDQIEFVDHKLDDAMVKIWSPGGSYTFENLPAPSAQTFRFAYEVTDDFTTDARFVEGAGIDYPAGTTVGVVNRGTDADPVYMYDVSTGAVLVDTVPTQGSTNAVSSGGTYDALNGKVDKNGTDRLMTADEGTKLAGIAASAQVNVLEGVQVNGSDLPITDKKVNIDITVKADKVSSPTVNDLASLDSNGNLADSGISKEVLSTDTTTTAAGNPVTFATKSAQIAEGVELLATAKQDLHGLPFPYVGGAYKNKLPLVLADIKALNTSGTWSGNTYTLDNTTFEVKEDDGYVTEIKANGTPTNNILYFRVAQNISVASPLIFSTGYTDTWEVNGHVMEMAVDNTSYKPSDVSGVEIPTGTYELHIAVAAGRAINNNYKPMLRSTTVSDYSFAPYSNICPISGIDEVEIGVSGKNILDAVNHVRETASHNITSTANANGSISISGTVDSTWAYITDVVNVDWEPGTYTFSIVTALSHNIYLELTYDDNTTQNLIINSGDRSATITTAKKLKSYVLVISSLVNGTQYNETYYLQVEKSASATEWNPYVSHTTTIPLPSTLYGFVADVDEGKVRVTKVIHKVTSLNRNNDYSFFAGLPANTKGGQYYTSELLCDRTPIGANGGRNEVYVNDSGAFRLNTYNAFSTAEDALAYFGGEFNICYTLATPIELDITPAILKLLEGTNVLTTNGDSIKVTYRDGAVATLADIVAEDERVDAKLAEVLGTKAEISAIADSEPNATASQPYAVREHFYKDGKFCTAIAQIASGATFNKGTNYVEGTIADNMIKQATFSGTTSNDGNLKLGNSVINILSAIVTDVPWCVAIPYVSNGSTFIHVIADDDSNTVKSSTAVSGIYYYV